MRKLASIQQVLDLIPIPEADLIELAQIQGWQAVVKKGEFSVGDLGVYFEIDAVPPTRPEFAFLWKGVEAPPKSMRIRTMRLRGCLSQGLLMPLRLLPEARGLELGTDVTALFAVSKYEPPPPDGMGDYGGPFPGDVSKTDETRIQSAPTVINEMQLLPYVITLKVDGTSSTFTTVDGEFHAHGRNHRIAESDNIFWRVARRYDLPRVMVDHPHLALQGEIVGPGIQKNRLGLNRIELRAFNLYDKRIGRGLSYAELATFCERHGIPVVPVVEEGESFAHTQTSLLKLAEGVYEGTKNEREGIVIRSREPRYSRALGTSLSFKVVNNAFLLKGGD